MLSLVLSVLMMLLMLLLSLFCLKNNGSSIRHFEDDGGAVEDDGRWLKITAACRGWWFVRLRKTKKPPKELFFKGWSLFSNQVN